MADDEKPDERPRPKYGELAPEGWVWRPPADAGRLDTSRPAPQAHPGEPAYGEPGGPDARHAHPGPAAPPPFRTEAPRWNAAVTIALIVFGFVGMTNSIGVLNAFPAAIQTMHVTDNLGDYTAAPPVAPLLAAGSVIQAVIWAVSAGLAIWQLTRKRFSFYIPLVAGVIAFIALLVVFSLVLMTDTALVDFYGGVTTSTPGIPSPTPGITTPGVTTPVPGATP
ncbi:MAG TPA: DUF6264 family protein [Leifsonia sp.]|jgi:hypothetical protein